MNKHEMRTRGTGGEYATGNPILQELLSTAVLLASVAFGYALRRRHTRVTRGERGSHPRPNSSFPRVVGKR